MNRTRCAIYTRKSSEEGLDQAFNTLDAQREAGLDYIKSQKHEGWTAVSGSYDDGGFSGGTMKRPALERLLEDIERARIDVVVVYKVDRLSRSLGDFARMMQLFDERGVSFVSVTQQFNTTTSMGRLTLNMLLSFAQFEREVASERIRDKIAATVKQGYWVCGRPPLGYRIQQDDEERGLYIVPDEALVVRECFQRYAENPSLLEVAKTLNAAGYRTKVHLMSTGLRHGGKPLTPKYIHTLLTNPLYIGKVRHTRNGETAVYKGRHEPLIETALWESVRAAMEETERSTQRRWTHSHLLKGKLRTHEGYAMSPSSVQRPLTKRTTTSQKRHVRYYVSQKALREGFNSCAIKTVNAKHLDDLVRAVVLDYVKIESLDSQPAEERDLWIRTLIAGVSLAPESIEIRIDRDEIDSLRTMKLTGHTTPPPPQPTCPFTPEVDERGAHIALKLAVRLKRLDGRRALLAPDGRELVLPSRPEPKRHLADAIGLAHRWEREITESGLSILNFCAAHELSSTRVKKLLPLTLLGPDVLRAALTGALPPSVTLECLLRTGRETLDWEAQSKMLRIEPTGATAS